MCASDRGKRLQLKQQTISNNEIAAIFADILASILNSDVLLTLVWNVCLFQLHSERSLVDFLEESMPELPTYLHSAPNHLLGKPFIHKNQLFFAFFASFADNMAFANRSNR